MPLSSKCKMEETEYQAILGFVRNKEYPSALPLQRRSNWRKKCKKFMEKRGALFFIHQRYGIVEVIRNSEKLDIIENLHRPRSELQERHYGVNKTRYKICQKYYWKTVHEDVVKYIQSCEHCIEIAKQRSESQKLTSSLKLLTTNKPFPDAVKEKAIDSLNIAIQKANELPCIYEWKLDIYSFEDKTYRGNQCIVILTNCQNCWIETLAIDQVGSTKIIANFLIKIICRHGFIKCLHIADLICKEDKSFLLRLENILRNLCHDAEDIPILKIATNIFKSSETLKSLIEKYCMEYIKDFKYLWDKYLKFITSSWNTFENEGSSPYIKLYHERPFILLPPRDPSNDMIFNLWVHTCNYLKKFNVQIISVEPACEMILTAPSKFRVSHAKDNVGFPQASSVLLQLELKKVSPPLEISDPTAL